jgi:hypothetical protein
MDNIYKINESTFKKVSKKVFRFLYGLWFPEKLLKPLINEIKEDRIKIQELLDELTEAQTSHQQFSSILEGLTNSMQALVWSKDKNHKYIVANARLCTYLFGEKVTTEECHTIVKGKTYTEILESCYNDHILYKLGLLSDEYTRESKHSCHFIEAVRIEEKEFLFYIIKIPQFENNIFIGTYAVAWEMSSRSEFMTDLLNRWIYDGKAIEVYKCLDQFSYAINPKVKRCSVFQHLCPHPERGGEECIHFESV